MSSRPSRDKSLTEELGRALRHALSAPDPRGDVRAVAVGDVTCLVRWRPRAVGPGHEVLIRIRQGGDHEEHLCTLHELRALPAACEARASRFLEEGRTALATVPEPLDRLRMLLAGHEA